MQDARSTGRPLLAALLTPWFALGIRLHVPALGLWIMGLRRVELLIAYRFIALGLVLVSLLSWGVLDERPAASYWLGPTLIIAGVLTGRGPLSARPRCGARTRRAAGFSDQFSSSVFAVPAASARRRDGQNRPAIALSHTPPTRLQHVGRAARCVMNPKKR